MTKAAKHNAERLRLLAGLTDQVLVVLPRGGAPSEYEPLRWDEAREMARGPHRVRCSRADASHPHASPAQERWQTKIGGSKHSETSD